MGWASYLEDMEERLTDGLDQIGQYVPGTSSPLVSSASPYEFNRRVTEWYSNARDFLKELRARIDLAADPTVELAHEVLALRQENEQLRKYKNEKQDKDNRLQTENLELRRKLERAYAEVPQTVHYLMSRLDKSSAANKQLQHQLAKVKGELAELRQAYSRLEAEKHEMWQTYADSLFDAYPPLAVREQTHSVDDLKRKFNRRK